MNQRAYCVVFVVPNAQLADGLFVSAVVGASIFSEPSPTMELSYRKFVLFTEEAEHYEDAERKAVARLTDTDYYDWLGPVVEHPLRGKYRSWMEQQ